MYNYEYFIEKLGDELSLNELQWITKNGHVNHSTLYLRLTELLDVFHIENYESKYIHEAYKSLMKLEQIKSKNTLNEILCSIVKWTQSLYENFEENKYNIKYIQNIVYVLLLIIKTFRFSPHFFPEGTSDFIKNSSWRYYKYPVVRQKSWEIRDVPVEQVIKMSLLDKKNTKNRYPFKEIVKNAMRLAEVGRTKDAIRVLNLENGSYGHSVMYYGMKLKFKLKESIEHELSHLNDIRPYKNEDYIYLCYIANIYFHAFIYSGKHDFELVETGLKKLNDALKLYNTNLVYNSTFDYNTQGCTFLEHYFCLPLTLYPYLKYILLNEEI